MKISEKIKEYKKKRKDQKATEEALEIFYEEFGWLQYNFLFLSYTGYIEALQRMNACLLLVGEEESPLYKEIEKMINSPFKISVVGRYISVLKLSDLIIGYFGG